MRGEEPHLLPELDGGWQPAGGCRGESLGHGPPSPFSCSRKCLCPSGMPRLVKPSLTVTLPSFRSGPLHTPCQHPEAERPAQASEGKQSHPPHPLLPHPPQSRGVGTESTAGGSCLLGLLVLPTPPLPCLLSQLGSEVSERPAPHPRSLTSPLPVIVSIGISNDGGVPTCTGVWGAQGLPRMLTGPPSNPGRQVALRTVYKQGTQSSKKEMTCPRSLSREAGSWARALTSGFALCLASG